MSPGDDVEAVIERSRRERHAVRRRRSLTALGVSASVTGTWLVYVTAAGHWGRVGDVWASAVTMVAGSFVAGSTPQGGGAVAFPVFTKVLDVPAEIARSFSLCIQTVGMGAATASILINRRRIEVGSLLIVTPVAVLSFVVATALMTDSDAPFAPSTLPGSYVKVTFTLIIAAMAVVVYRTYRQPLLERIDELPVRGPRITVALVLAGLLGGLAASLVGSGADVLAYVVVVVLVGVNPRVGVATSVVVMTAVSVAGFVQLGLVDGQLDVSVADGQVLAVGGQAVTGLEVTSGDLFGFWLAAVPVVVWGAPLGSLVSSRVTDRRLVTFVVALATAEVISTVLFLDELRSDPALVAYGLVGGTVVIGGLVLLHRHRRALLGLPPVDPTATHTRESLDVAPSFGAELDPLSSEEAPDADR